MATQDDDAKIIWNQAENVYGHVVQVGELHGDLHVHVAPDPTGVVVPLAGLDEAVPDFFVGRDREVAELLAALAPDRPEPEVVVVSAGMGGVGKTALARRSCAVAVQRGWFPGGALMVDMRGYSPDGRAVAAPGVLGPLLRGLGVAQEQIPVPPAEQATVYHQILDTLAREGKPVLLMLDNVSAGEQVRDLLPRHRAHGVVVTTRETLALPGARTLELDVFPTAEALAMLEQALLRADQGDPRVGRDAEAADRLVGLCGRLPLAVEIGAALLAEDPDLSFTDLADELEQAASKAAVLRHGDRGVAATFDLSWRRLRNRDPPAARLLGLLTLDPGPGLSTDAAAALAGVEPTAVRSGLRLLRHVHLVSLVDGHWRMHDLVNAHVRDRVEAGESADETRSAALERLLDFYRRTADDALTAVNEGRSSDRKDAIAWFERERLALIAGVGLAHGRVGFDLANALSGLLQDRHYLTDWITVARRQADVGTGISDAFRGHALIYLGRALKEAGRFDEAVDAHRQAAECCDSTELADEALHEYGLALRNAGRYDESLRVVRRLRQRGFANGDTRSVAVARSTLSTVLAAKGRPQEAITERRAAIELWRKLDEKAELGKSLNAMGLALLSADQFFDGIRCFEEAVATSAAAGDPDSEETARRNFATFVALKDARRGIAVARASVHRFRELDEPRLVGDAQLTLGQVLAKSGKLVAAIDVYREAVETYRAADDRFGEGEALIELSDALSLAGRRDEAADIRGRSVTTFRDLGDPFRGGLAESAPRTRSTMETSLHSMNSRASPGCCLLWLALIGTGGYFTVREAGWWWLLGGLVALLVLGATVGHVIQALQKRQKAWARKTAAGLTREMTQSPARYPKMTYSQSVPVRGCLPTIVAVALAWYLGDRWWGTGAAVAIALATFVILTTIVFRRAARRFRDMSPSPDS